MKPTVVSPGLRRLPIPSSISRPNWLSVSRTHSRLVPHRHDCAPHSRSRASRLRDNARTYRVNQWTEVLGGLSFAGMETKLSPMSTGEKGLMDGYFGPLERSFTHFSNVRFPPKAAVAKLLFEERRDRIAQTEQDHHAEDCDHCLAILHQYSRSAGAHQNAEFQPICPAEIRKRCPAHQFVPPAIGHHVQERYSPGRRFSL